MKTAFKSFDHSPDESLAWSLLIREFRLLGYGLTGWLKADPLPDQRTTFTCHRESGWRVLLTGIILMILFESVSVHLLLRNRHPILSQAHALLAAYGLLWLLGDYQAIKKNRTTLEPGTLHFRLGLRRELVIPLGMIAQVKLGEPEGLESSAEIRLGEFAAEPKLSGYEAFVVMGKPTVHLVLRSALTLPGLFGDKKLTRIGLGIDDPETFLQALKGAE